MRVVHVVQSLDAGGMEKGVVTLVRRTARTVDHVVVCLQRGGEWADLLRGYSKVTVLHKAPGNSVGFLARLVSTLGRLSPDVVHTRNWPGMDGVVAARLAGIAAVVHGEHGLGSDDPTGRDRKRLLVRRLLAGWPATYVCVSACLERWLREVVGVRRPITQILNGVDSQAYYPGPGHELRARLGIPSNSFVVGIVGRLDPIKNHGTLMSAITGLRAEGLDVELVVVGDGPERPTLERQAGVGIRLLGHRDDVAELMRTFDLFALTSTNEGISNTVLEAMSTGLPVVASAVGGNEELVEPEVTGALFPATDDRALAEAIRRYAASPELRRAHGLAARRRVERRFSVDAMVGAYTAVWEATSGRHRSDRLPRG